MKVTEIHRIDDDAGKGYLSVIVETEDGKRECVTLLAGEPEDASFHRDLNDAYSIINLVKSAYDAGKRGEDFAYEFVDENGKEHD